MITTKETAESGSAESRQKKRGFDDSIRCVGGPWEALKHKTSHWEQKLGAPSTRALPKNPLVKFCAVKNEVWGTCVSLNVVG